MLRFLIIPFFAAVAGCGLPVDGSYDNAGAWEFAQHSVRDRLPDKQLAFPPDGVQDVYDHGGGDYSIESHVFIDGERTEFLMTASKLAGEWTRHSLHIPWVSNPQAKGAPPAK